MTRATGPAVRAPVRDPERPLLAGTRGSPLALIQTRDFLDRVRRVGTLLRRPQQGNPPVFAEHIIRTTGDTTQAAGTRLADIGGKGLFAKEIHEALAEGRIDFAVHSLKDLESELPAGIVLGCTLPREDPRDALILGPACGVLDSKAVDPADPYACLPRGAVIGTASVRRQAQLLHARPDLTTTVLRGNVGTRLDKVASGLCAASVLAYAGLRRMGLGDRAGVVLDVDTMVPAVCQGIIGVTVRANDTDLLEMLVAIEDAAARTAATAERALLAALDGSCRTPIGGYAQVLPGGELHLTGLVARADGSFLLRRVLHGRGADAARMGAELGASLRADSPRDVFG
ncbi:MAG TPA: hydroxymethylbilane synthase [Acetobacteraceae bacterium]|nr:hydroxymethylbilane synthase [Acetobacteraceae bacterium]